MNTITNVPFDEQLFSQFDSCVVLLYEMEGIDIDIPLSNFDALTFIRPFNRISQCQNYITNNERKTFTLFIFGDNIQTWFYNEGAIRPNIEDIIIFCPSVSDKKYLRDWTRRYTKKVKNVITSNELEQEILIFGMKYINDLSLDFKGNEETLNLLRTYHQRLTSALIDVFNQSVNKS